MIDELQAFEIATESARKRGRPWRSPYAIFMEDGKWQVSAANDAEDIALIDPETGKIFFNDSPLDPVRAFAVAREFAKANELRWVPWFFLILKPTYWIIESNGAALGGNVSIYVGHDGTVIKHEFNPK